MLIFAVEWYFFRNYTDIIFKWQLFRLYCCEYFLCDCLIITKIVFLNWKLCGFFFRLFLFIFFCVIFFLFVFFSFGHCVVFFSFIFVCFFFLLFCFILFYFFCRYIRQYLSKTGIILRYYSCYTFYINSCHIDRHFCTLFISRCYWNYNSASPHLSEGFDI